MAIKSRWSAPVPVVSLPTYLFESSAGPLPTVPIWIDANRPDTHYFTMTTYREWAKRFAAGLTAAGLQPGDRVLLFSGNNIFFPVVILGVMMAGGIFTGANPGYNTRELAHQLSDSDPRFLLVAGEALDTGLEAAKIGKMGKDRVFTFDDAVFDGKGQGRLGTRHWKHLIASPETGERFQWEEVSTLAGANRTAALNYSSGTTGLPKGVEISHYNFVANCFQVKHGAELDPDFKENLKTARWLCFLPMYHAMAQTFFATIGPKRGIPSYMMPKFDFLKMLDCVQRFRITDLILVPPIVVALAKHPAPRNGTFDLSSVRLVNSGAAPLGKEVSEEVEALWEKDKVKVKQGWGLTEATCWVLGWDPRDPGKPGSVGELAANCEAMIIDQDGITELGCEQRGEIWIRAPNVMKGYWRNPTATKEALTEDRWLKTGDVAYYDKEGKFFIVDRIKEMIKVKGNQVAPAELEAILLEHPSVADAAVIGVQRNDEEHPRAYIVTKQGTRTTAEEIVQFMEKRASRTKRITGGVVFIQSIPRNPSGKILRKYLRERAKAEHGASQPRASKL
ncbi:MAG: hypothetical protein M1837_005055 [Sclerophora amabilis]|nr:MAG: hypothetical protein M1837_005055 [Sclerophora amabilis]